MKHNMDGESVEKCLSISLAHFQQEKMKVVKAYADDQESEKQAERPAGRPGARRSVGAAIKLRRPCFASGQNGLIKRQLIHRANRILVPFFFFFFFF